MLKRFFIQVVMLLSLAIIANAAAIQLNKTGQTKCYDTAGAEINCVGTGQDGDQQKGSAWPIPRFTDNANGTVTDVMTGLIWLKNANCYGKQSMGEAMVSANSLANGTCGLSDSSNAGQWRLPNRNELQSLIDRSMHHPALPTGHPFSNVQSGSYWSSSTDSHYPGNNSWSIYINDGSLYSIPNPDILYVLPVSGGQ